MAKSQAQHSSPLTPLCDARVLVVGVGALGCAAALALRRAPLAALTLIDDDVVELSNLQRQVLYRDSDIGAPKVAVAASRLADAAAEVRPLEGRLGPSNAADLIADHDYVIDGCDDPETKYLINRTAIRCGVPFCYGGVTGTAGQWMAVRPKAGPCLECVFPRAGGTANDGGCSTQGVLAPVAGVVGAGQAAVALAEFSTTPARAGALHVYRVATRRHRVVAFEPRPDCSDCCVPATVGAHPATSPRRLTPCPL